MLVSVTLFNQYGGYPTETDIKGVCLSNNWNFDNHVVERLLTNPSFVKQNKEELARYEQRAKVVKEAQWFVDYEKEKPEQVFYKPAWQDYLARKQEYDDDTLSATGVVDSPQQLLDLYDFEKDPRKFVISLVKVRREDQPPQQGWRYHRWGDYYGTQKPEFEYLYDDKHIDHVFTFHIYQVKE